MELSTHLEKKGLFCLQEELEATTYLTMFVFLIAYVERTQLIRAKVPILRFKEKGRWEQKSQWWLFCFFTGQKEAFMWLLPFLLFSVIWSLISMSTTQWASETHSFWEVMPMVSADNTRIWEAVDQLTGPFTNQSSHKQCICYLNKDGESFSFFTCCAYVLFPQLISG